MQSKVLGKKEMVNLVAEKGNMTKKDAEESLNAFLEVIAENYSHGITTRIIPFGNFEIRNRAERIGRDPRTGREIKIEARNVAVFKPGKALKETVNV